MNRFHDWITKKADAMPVRRNVYLDEFVLRHYKFFCCLWFVLSFAVLTAGVIAIIFKGELWFILLFLAGGIVGLICSAYQSFEKCVIDDEKIEKRAVICLKRVYWCDVVLIRDIKYTGRQKRIVCIYGADKLLADFESPAAGIEELLDMAKQKGIKIKRCRDLTLRQMMRVDNLK